MTVANVNVTKVLFKRGNTVQNNNYTGVSGEISIDTQTKTLRVHDGITPGGNILTTGGIYGNSNVTTYLTSVAGNIIPSVNVTYSLGNATNQWRDLWVSNNTIYIGNVPITVSNGSLLINGNSITGGTGTDDVLRANVGAYQIYANANAATQTISINSINANVTAANIAIQTLSANIGTLVAGAPAALDTLLELANALGNSDSFSSTMVNWLGNITSNVTAANTSINTINANVGAFQIYANANAATQSTSIDSINSNITAANSSINTFNANLGAFQTYANLHFIDSSYSNSNVASYLPTYSGNIAANIVKNGYTWTFGTTGNLTLPQGTVVSETANTTVITPPNALAGQSLVIRLTGAQGIVSDHPGGFTDGDTITLTVTPDYSYAPVTGTVDYTFTGATSVQLGRALTGTLTFTAEAAKPISWTIPVSSTMTTFTITLSNASGFDISGISPFTLTTTGSSEDHHIHLIAGDPSITDIYLGDDDQYVKIEKNAGNVVIGTDTNSRQWTFDTDGVLTAPNIVIAGNTNLFGSYTALIQPTNNLPIATISSGTAGGITSVWVEDLGDIANSNIAAIYTPLAGTGTVRVAAGSNATSVNLWDFNPDGNLTLPESGYLKVGSGIVAGFASSPAPVISGFSSVSAENFRFLANGVNILSSVAGTYSNTNVAAYLSTITSGNVGAGNLTVINNFSSNVITANSFTYANGVNILSTVAGTYSDANVTTYLPTYTGNIAGNIVKNGYTWTFSNTGTTTFPTGVTLSNARGPNTVNFTTAIDKSFQIETQTNTTGRLWSFGTDGNLTLPQFANINFSNGVNILSTITAGSTYSNVNVEAYIGGNIGAFQTYANANAATQATSINTINNTLTSSNVGIGDGAGSESQGTSAVAVGSGAGSLNQGLYSVAIGNDAGADNQGDRSVAVGTGAGRTNQGDYAVAIGRNAGYTNQGNNSIIINATTGTLNQITANTFTVAPVRNDVANVAQILFYNTTNKEITYGNTINIAGNINAGQFNFANGVNILSSITAVANLSTLTGNISWTAVGANPPTFTTASNGTKIVLWPSISSTMVDYAIGIEAGNTWFSIPQAANNFGYKWYAGNTTIATLLGNGTLTTGNITTTGNISATNFVGNGVGLTNVTVSAAGNIVGTSSNVTLVAGNYSYTFDNTGNVTLPANVFVGVTNTFLPNTVTSFSSNVNYYSQVTLQNKSSGNDATADYIVTADNGSDTVNFLDLGIINSGYDNTTPSNSLGNIVFAADSYIYAQGNASNANQSGGNLAIGTATIGKTIKFFAGGTTSSAIAMTVANTGVTVSSNLTTNRLTTVTGIFWSNGTAWSSSGGSGTDDVLRANVGAYQIYANANLGTATTNISTINANVGAYQIYANANLGTATTNITTLFSNAATQATAINSINANIGAYQIYANANLGTATTNISTINANIGAYQIYANANLGTATTNITTLFSNAATQATSINSINANIGAFQLYANANIGTLFNGNTSTNANIGAFQTYANANVAALRTSITSLATGANTNTAAYLAAGISANITTTGNVSAGNVIVNGQPTTYGYVNGAYLLAQNTTDQSVGLNEAVNFQTTSASNGSIITKTSNSQVTLTAGNTYKLEGIIRRLSSSSTWAAFRWYNVTNSAYVGIEGFSEVTNSPSAIGSTVVATGIVTPTVNTIYELRQTTVNTISVSGGYAGYEITQINPAIAVQATASGTVAATVVANTSPVSSTNVNGGSSVSPALTILTVAIPTAGTWRLDAEMRVYIPGEGYMAAAFYDNGTLISGSEYFIAAGGVTQTGAATGQYGGFMSYNLTTTGARTVTLGAWATTNSQFITSDDGRTWLRATRLDSIFALNALDTMTTTGNVSVGGNLSVSGNIVSTGQNVSLVAGNFTARFDNTGILTLPTIGGDEGGEINFGIPATNTTLNTRVVLDVFQDRIRIFDGNTKGVYIDLSQASSGVGTLLNNRVSGLVNAGTFVTMDLIKATVTSAGNRGLSLATTTGTLTYNIGGTYGYSSSATSGGFAASSQSLTTTPTASIFAWSFPNAGDTSTYILTDTTNSRAYRITLMIGGSFNNNMISIERLI